MSRHPIVLLLLAGVLGCAGPTGRLIVSTIEASWTRESERSSSVSPLQIDLSRPVSVRIRVPSLPNRWLVPNLYLPTTEPLGPNLEMHGVAGHDVSITITVTDASGRHLITLPDATSEGWGARYGDSEVRWHRPLELGPLASPLIVQLTINAASSQPATARFELESTDYVISQLRPNKRLQLTGLRLPEIW